MSRYVDLIFEDDRLSFISKRIRTSQEGLVFCNF